MRNLIIAASLSLALAGCYEAATPQSSTTERHLLALTPEKATMENPVPRRLPAKVVRTHPELTAEKVEAIVRKTLNESAITNLTAEVKKVDALSGEPQFDLSEYSGDSDVWFVKASGKMIWPFRFADKSGKKPRQERDAAVIVFALDADDGHIISARMDY